MIETYETIDGRRVVLIRPTCGARASVRIIMSNKRDAASSISIWIAALSSNIHDAIPIEDISEASTVILKVVLGGLMCLLPT